MKNDLETLAGLLDGDIEKGLSLERRDLAKDSRIEAFEESIIKGLSFDPFQPIEMNDDSSYYNPYQSHPMGGYYPHAKESWTSQGDNQHLGVRAGTRNEDGYRQVGEFHRIAGDAPMDADFYGRGPNAQAPSTSRFAQLRRSIPEIVEDGLRKGMGWDDDLMKGGVPVGTVHTYADGQKYKKVAEGKWVPSAGLETKKTQNWLDHKDSSVRAHANHGIERHAEQKAKIESLMKQREREQVVIGEAKNQAVQAAATHMKNVTSKMYDGKPPKGFDEEHDAHMTAHGAKASDPKKMLAQAHEGLKPKTQDVKVHFTHQGKAYSHHFEGIQAAHHQEAIERVTEILKQKLPGSQLTRVQATSPKKDADKNA